MNAMVHTMSQELFKTCSPEGQKEFLRSLKPVVTCEAEHVQPESGVGLPDVCRIEGSVSTQEVANTIIAGGTPCPSDVLKYFNTQLKERICFLDGGMGTRIQAEKLEEADYRGERFKDFGEIDANGVPVSLKGNNDLLVFTKPQLMVDIHKEYFLGGSDICETNTFNGTSISQGEYKMQSIVYELNKVGAELAKKAAAEVTKQEPHKPRFVAGAVGPTSRTLSVSPSVEDPSFRNVTWDELVEAYVEQIGGLVDGGVDLLMIETIFDTQNAKAAIFAVDEYFQRSKKERLPVMISATIVDNSGRTLSGQTIEAFFISIKHAKAFTVGINCALGAAQMKKFYKMLVDMNPGWCHVYPNAGLPNAMGGYDEDPEIFSTNILDYAKDGLLNFVGGCCGTFPSHIAAVAAKVKDCPPRKLPEKEKYPSMQLSGLEPSILTPESGFQWVGERCNLMGSAKFKKLVDAYKWDDAMEVCLAQCEKKADILDFNFDSDLIDGQSAMGKFMRLCVTEPNVARLPFMIDSSKWPVIEEGLKCVQGKSIVNSISLKVGETEFLRQAKLCQRYGAAVVIMAFDEQGQAATYEDKVRICVRSYKLLRTKLDFNPEDIIFDCNVLTIATGLPEHNSYGIDFINAVAEIKRTCPCVSFSGGLSNLSFSFRGLNKFRDAMHSVFLYHAVPKGLNMSIVNPGGLPRYSDIDPTFRKLAEEVILNNSADGNHVERFIDFAEKVRNPPPAPAPVQMPTLKIEKSTAVQQKEFLGTLKCEVSCSAEHVIPEAGAGVPDVCRMEGKCDKKKLADTIIKGGTPTPSEVLAYFNEELKQRICYLDGGMGTRIQAEKLEEADYRGDRFKDFNQIDANGVPVSLKGNNDLLVFTKPKMVTDIHKEYFAAGSDICETNTFNGTTISQGEYKMQEIVYELNKTGAELAKKAAAEVTKDEPHKPRFVAGAVGPTSRTLSVSPSVEDPSFRNVTWDELVEAYVEQIRGLVDGGVDLLMIETIFDTQNAKAAIFAVDEFFLRTKKERLPVMISATIVDNSGRTLSGQTIEAFFVSIKHAKAFTVGINCALGAAQMKKFYKMLVDMNPGWCHVYPNAGLPNAMGGYDEDPEIFSTNLYDYAKDGLLNFVGGCCGTFPSHIAALANKLKDCPTRKLPELPKYPNMQLSGLEPCVITPESGFQLIGERCNLMGSAKFKKLVDAYKWDEAMEVCLAQCEKKADVLDFNFDSDLIDGKSAMGKFMRLCVTEPNVARLPFMIDSSKWPVIEEGLKCVQGKSIVNSISLKVGEEEFLRQAKLVQRYGAAVVIMAFDEQGQAATFEDKVRICQRSYKLLRTKLDFAPEDIIFDCNVLTIATGLPEHNSYGIDFINAVSEIKRTCPCVSFSGGLSNLSFSFRGLNSLRDAMHTVFLYHAVPKGLNMSIVNPGGLPRYCDIDANTQKLCEEVILNKSADGNHVERFLEFAERVKNPPAAPAAGAPPLKIEKSTSVQQKDFLKSLKCEVDCKAEHVCPEPGTALPDVCRMEGSADKKKIATTIINGGTPSPGEVIAYFNQELKQRICFLDGGMGTRIQAEKLEEADYRGEQFKDFNQIDNNGVPVSLKGNNDLLVLTKAQLMVDIHKEYFAAGSDICETNTFNGTTISQGEYKMQDIVYELNKTGAQLAKKAAAEVTKDEPHKPRFVAGAVGPTSRTLSVSPSVEDPSFRNVTWDELVEAYVEQIRGLVDGGVDLLMIETIFDTQNAKAAIFAVDEFFLRTKKERLPVMISATIVDNSGRTLSGQTIEAFFISIKHAKAFTVGINCALGAAQMKKFYKMLVDLNPGWCHVYPNAGLPNAMGGYDEDPEIFSTNIHDYAKDGLLNFVGGCCGTFPSHIAAVAQKVKECPVRKLPELPKYPCMQLSGLEPCILQPDSGFQLIGERCNLMGSAKFKKLVDAYKWDEAMEVCLAQCEKKADILDFNFDSDLIDGKSAMGKFMRLCVTEPNVARLPFMIDSSKWPVIEEGLKCVQGKSIVNSISLKVGEEEFLRQAKLVQRYGAAVVIMAFDEQGQAATYEDKVRICTRSYKLLRSKLDFNPEDIIFDCNVLTIATGLPEHNSYGLDFIKAVEEIKRSCPCVSFSGGLSNLSFSFRGLNSLRDAMHSVFLYHAVPKGLNMSIVNPGSLPRYNDIDENCRKLCEEVILNKSADGKHVERFLEFAENVKKPAPAAAASGGPAAAQGKDAWRNGTYTERLHHGLIHGIDKFIDEDVEEARVDLKIPLHVIEGPLMQGMGIIGDLFGAGKMFLPQVIKSARVMKKAVAWLTPFMEEEKRLKALENGEDPDQPKWNGVVLMATVKGDVHDIGKNIVGVVLGCNNFKVIDMGVMVPCEKILERAIAEKVDVIGLSGLITPSLDEMVYVAEKMKEKGMNVPLMIGGATTSKRHTAVKLATKYDHGVIHVLDASRSCTVVSSVLSGEKKSYLEDIKEEYTEIREEYYATLIDKKWKTLSQAQGMKPEIDWTKVPPKPQFIGNLCIKEHPITEIIEYIDWSPFFQVYQLRGKYPNRDYPAIFNDARVGEEAKKLFAEAKEMLEWIVKEDILKCSGVVGIWPANSVGDDIEVYANESREKVVCKFYGLRQQLDMGETTCWCQSDFIAPKGVAPDYIAAFACTGGMGCHEQRKKFEDKGEIDRAILLEAVADRLAEAFAELIHLKIRTTLWGYAPDENLSLEDLLKVRYQGIRPAPGYPSQPDHREKKTLWDLLDINRLTEDELKLTESYMMQPGASVSALVFAHPEAKYFSVGQVNKDQVEDYSNRRGEDGVAGTERWLGSTVLGYEKK